MYSRAQAGELRGAQRCSPPPTRPQLGVHALHQGLSGAVVDPPQAVHYRPRPRIGKNLTDRQDGQPPEAIAIAWSAQQRLHRTWARLEARAKRRTIIAVAAARELAGFAWAITQIE